jgi:hypothetical protein
MGIVPCGPRLDAVGERESVTLGRSSEPQGPLSVQESSFDEASAPLAPPGLLVSLHASKRSLPTLFGIHLRPPRERRLDAALANARDLGQLFDQLSTKERGQDDAPPPRASRDDVEALRQIAPGRERDLAVAALFDATRGNDPEVVKYAEASLEVGGSQEFTSLALQTLTHALRTLKGKEVAFFLAAASPDMDEVVSQTGWSQEKLEKLREIYLALPPQLKDEVLRNTTEWVLQEVNKHTLLLKLPFTKRFREFQQLLDNPMASVQDLVGEWAKDLKMGGDDASTLITALLTDMKDDVTLKAKVMTAVLQSGILSKKERTAEDLANCLSAILTTCGTATIKIGQAMADSPEIPETFRAVFKKLQNKNDPISALEVWRQIPPEMRVGITELGPVLGTGSVKQTVEVTWNGALGIKAGKYALSVVLPGAKEGFEKVMPLFERLDGKAGAIARGLRDTMEREFDLEKEADAQRAARNSPLAASGALLIPEVFHSTKTALLQELVEGPTLRDLEEAGKTLDPEQKKALAAGLNVLVTAAFNPRLYEGTDETKRMLVVPDPHPGNLKLVPRVGGGYRLAVLDWGQHGELQPSQSRELLRLLAVLAVDSVVPVPIVNRNIKVADIRVVNNVARRFEDRSAIVRVFAEYVRDEVRGSQTPERVVESMIDEALQKPTVEDLLATRFTKAKVEELLPQGYDPAGREDLVEKLSKLLPEHEPGSDEAKGEVNALIDKEWMIEDVLDAFFASALVKLRLPQGYLDAGKLLLYAKLVEQSFKLGRVRELALLNIYLEYKAGPMGNAVQMASGAARVVAGRAQRVVSWFNAALSGPASEETVQ